MTPSEPAPALARRVAWSSRVEGADLDSNGGLLGWQTSSLQTLIPEPI